MTIRPLRAKALAPFVILGGLVVLLAAGCGSGDTEATVGTSGSSATTSASSGGTDAAGGGSQDTSNREAAPGFSGTTMDGEEVSLESYEGRPLFLTFWASW